MFASSIAALNSSNSKISSSSFSRESVSRSSPFSSLNISESSSSSSSSSSSEVSSSSNPCCKSSHLISTSISNAFETHKHKKSSANSVFRHSADSAHRNAQSKYAANTIAEHVLCGNMSNKTCEKTFALRGTNFNICTTECTALSLLLFSTFSRSRCFAASFAPDTLLLLLNLLIR